MSISYPSNDVTLLRVPNVTDFRASFVYDFFTVDEQTNDSGEAPNSVRVLPAEAFDAARIDQIRRVVPRFVRFDFTSAVIPQASAGNEFMHPPDVGRTDLDIASNLDHLQGEDTFAASDASGLEFQDGNIEQKLFIAVSGSVGKRVSSFNRNVQDQVEAQGRTVLSDLGSEHSLLDAARAFADDTSSAVSNNVIVNALNQIAALRLKFIDDATRKELIDDEFARVRDLSFRAQVNNRIVGRVVKNIVNDPMSIYSDEFTSINKRAQSIQASNVAVSNPRTFDASEFDTVLDAVSTKPIDAHDHPAATRIIGYIIEKSEVAPDGKLRAWPPIIVENARASTAVDLQVAYGRVYVYTIRTVAQLEVRTTVDGQDSIVMALGLVGSPRSPRSQVNCVEEVPPPPPADFNVTWDYTNDAPLLHWSFPVNAQRDIKKFQVFRRGSVLEPFELIRELNFDDSQVRAKNPETPDPTLVTVLDDPLTNHLDRGFTRASRAIYALCSVDAHALTSGYSIQLEVRFDGFKNVVRKRLIARSGAPKSYPNLTLDDSQFTDTIKSSGHTQVRVVFDPELLRVTDRAGNDLQLLTFDNRDAGGYRLQLINTDVMKEEVLDVTLTDRRPPRGTT